MGIDLVDKLIPRDDNLCAIMIFTNTRRPLLRISYKFSKIESKLPENVIGSRVYSDYAKH
jgi:hypothetical protein